MYGDGLPLEGVATPRPSMRELHEESARATGFEGVGVWQMMGQDLLESNPDCYQNAALYTLLFLGSFRSALEARGMYGEPHATPAEQYLQQSLEVSRDALTLQEYNRCTAFLGLLTAEPATDWVRNRRDQRITVFPREHDGISAEYIGRSMAYQDIQGALQLGKLREQSAESRITDVGFWQGQAEAANRLIRDRNELLDGSRYVLPVPPADQDDHYGGWTVPQLEEGPDYVTLEQNADMVVQKAKFSQVLAGALEQSPENEARLLEVGAKAAHLERLNAILCTMHEQGLLPNVEIPAFMSVPTDIYGRWKDGEGIDAAINEIQDWIAKNGADKRYVVRSSAVFSEDGEHTGAGMYESVLVSEQNNAEDLALAIERVYESLETESARAYRASIGVDNELMGLVVQELSPSNAGYGCLMVTLDTAMPHAPELVRYSLESGKHPLMRTGGSYITYSSLPLSRNGCEWELGSDVDTTAMNVYASRFHVPPDRRAHDLVDSWQAAQAGFFAEAVLGRPVEIEMAIGWSGEFDKNYYLLQARPLPDAMLKPVQFDGFPEASSENMLAYAGDSVGVYNGLDAIVDDSLYLCIDSLSQEGPEHQGARLLVFGSSFAEGDNISDYRRELSELNEEQRSRLVVLVKHHSDPKYGFGHLETFFAEIGVGVIFKSLTEADEESRVLATMTPGKSVKIYSNGYQGKVFVTAAAQQEFEDKIFGNNDD